MKKTFILLVSSLLILTSCKDSAEEYSKIGYSKYILTDFKGAIADFTKAIEINPNDAVYYYKRGLSKNELKDYKGAISDYTRAIEPLIR